MDRTSETLQTELGGALPNQMFTYLTGQQSSPEQSREKEELIIIKD